MLFSWKSAFFSDEQAGLAREMQKVLVLSGINPTTLADHARGPRDHFSVRTSFVIGVVRTNEKEGPLMNLKTSSTGYIRRGWSLTQADVLLCALPIVLFLSIVSLV